MLVGLKEATLDLSLNAGFAAASDTDVLLRPGRHVRVRDDVLHRHHADRRGAWYGQPRRR